MKHAATITYVNLEPRFRKIKNQSNNSFVPASVHFISFVPKYREQTKYKLLSTILFDQL